MIARSSVRAVRGAMDSAAGTSASRRRPCAVSSNIHATANAGTKAIASVITSAFIVHGGASNTGSKVAPTCTSSHAVTRYKPAMRMTLRRFSSAMKPPVVAKARPPFAGAAPALPMQCRQWLRSAQPCRLPMRRRWRTSALRRASSQTRSRCCPPTTAALAPTGYTVWGNSWTSCGWRPYGLATTMPAPMEIPQWPSSVSAAAAPKSSRCSRN